MTQKNVKHILGTGEEQVYIRLYADDGKALTNDGGETVWNCVDVTSTDGWTEIDAPQDESDEASIADYENALAELGVDV